MLPKDSIPHLLQGHPQYKYRFLDIEGNIPMEPD